MKKEVIMSGKSIEEAVGRGARELGLNRDDVSFEVLEIPKKGFMGLGEKGAKVRVFGAMSSVDVAVGFVENIITHMGLIAKVEAREEKNGKNDEIKIDISGNDLGILIGYHGDILNSLQYLTYLAVNKNISDADDDSSGFVKITIDVEKYREKREETLRALAIKMADRVGRYKRPVTLEPMGSYERKIIHSTIQEIPGVMTYSVGQDDNRKIVVAVAGSSPRSGSPSGTRPPYSQRGDRSYNRGNTNTRKPSYAPRTAEKDDE